MAEQLEDDYGLSKVAQSAALDAPALDYGPPRPRAYNPPILQLCHG